MTNEQGSEKKKLTGVQWVLIGAGALIAVIGLNSLGGGTTATPEKTPSSQVEETPVDLPLSGECDNVNRYLNRAVEAMGTAGNTSTLDDLLISLKDNGETLTQGFDAKILGSQENWDLVRGAGEDLLRIRVGLVQDSDIKKASDSFKTAYGEIQTICATK
jgi:hypothetical protein